MLKNVAIPLMLAASQAEAQEAELSKEMQEAVKASLRADMAKTFKGLQAAAPACTVASSQAADNIKNLAQAVTDAQGALDTAEKAVTDLKAADGAWGLAKAAREAAVTAAKDQEAAENIAPLLDALDVAAEAERAAAQGFVTADRAFQDGVALAAVANSENTTAQELLGTLETAKNNAEAAVQTANDQIAKETLWRRWRYCELGAAPANAALPDSSKGWWQMVQDSYTAARPAECVVPAVMSGDETPVEVRAAVTYFTASGASPGLPVESEDGSQRWTAQLVLDGAQAAESATSTPAAMGGIARTMAGQVAWRVGDLMAKTWVKNKRTRELAWYRSINTSRTGAETVATEWATGATRVTGATPTDQETALGLAASQDGPKKALDAQTLLRDASADATPGSGYSMPGARTQSQVAGEEWKTHWAITAASMDAWTGANTTKGPTLLWWEAARVLSVAMNAWHVNWGTESAELTVGTMTATAAGATSCNLLQGDWTTDNSLATVATTKGACKTACEQTSVNVLLQTVDTVSPTVDNGGIGPKLTAHADGWCGAYSFNDAEADASLKCQLMLAASNAQEFDATTAAANACENFTNVADFATKQAAIQAGWDGVTDALYNNMQAAVDAQAALEQAWLQAWYLQQYWNSIAVQLGTTDQTIIHDKMRAAYTEFTRLDGADSNDDTTAAGAETIMTAAETALETAEADLAKLQAATASAQATVTALGTRILRADAQLSELATLVKASPDVGTLDAAAALRVKAFNDYNNDGTGADPKGGAAVAADAKAAADLAVKQRTAGAINETDYEDETRGDGGALLEDRAVALAVWNKAKKQVTSAESDLTAALGGEDLAALRQKVEDDTATWNQQNDVLDGLVADVKNAEATLKAAEKAKDDAVLDCQIKAYDAYRTTLEAEMVQRNDDLKTIQALLRTAMENKPAPGTAGARCEKALSNGTFRPARGEAACAEGLCCGAARVWMAAGDGVEDAAWRTIETCQDLTAETYDYQPPRAPMATTMPAKVSVPFTCIEGAKKLAAAASAVAAAVYMLA